MYVVIIPEADHATLPGKIDQGQHECKFLIDIWNGEEAYETGLCEKWEKNIFGLRTSKNKKALNLATIGKYG